MIEKALDLLSKNKGERRETLMEIIKFLFISFMSLFVYRWVFGDFDIIPFKDFEKILLFFTSGDFIKPSIIFIILWYFWYHGVDFIIMIITTNHMEKVAKIFSDLNKDIVSNNHQLLIPTTIILPFGVGKILKSMLQFIVELSFIRKGDNGWEAGYSFHKIENFVIELSEGEDEIDLSYFFDSIIITVQFMIIYFCYLVWNNSISCWFSLFMMLLIIIILLLNWIGIILGLLFKVYITPIKNRLEDFREGRITILTI